MKKAGISYPVIDTPLKIPSCGQKTKLVEFVLRCVDLYLLCVPYSFGDLGKVIFVILCS